MNMVLKIALLLLKRNYSSYFKTSHRFRVHLFNTKRPLVLKALLIVAPYYPAHPVNHPYGRKLRVSEKLRLL